MGKKHSKDAEVKEMIEKLDSLYKLLDSLEMSLYRLEDVNDSLTNLIYEYSATSTHDEVKFSETHDINENLNKIDNTIEDSESVETENKDNGLTPIRQSSNKD